METPTTTERTEHPVPTCWICGAPLKVALTHNRNGKVALTLWCGTDGRHWRAFCNDKATVAEVVAKLEAQAVMAGAGIPATPHSKARNL